MFINLVPAFTIVLATTLLGEHISLFKILSALIIILGVYLATRPENSHQNTLANQNQNHN
jgi:drug/metabolite transporter (DMT)-like permease